MTGRASVPALGFLLLLLGAAPCVLAQASEVEKKQSRGLSAPSAYQLDDLDAINLFSGNLTLGIPLGQEYPVAEALSYRFSLKTNSNVWHFEQIYQSSTDTQETVATLDTQVSNAGLGWQLSFGRMYPPNTPPLNDTTSWLMLEGDGSRRGFSGALHSAAATTDVTVAYTRDGSYLRRVEKSNGEFEVEAPDGTVRVFRSDGWLRQIRDRFGNALDFTYDLNFLTWTMTDSTGRTHIATFESDPTDPELIIANKRKRLKTLDLAAFNGARAVYNFDYQTVNLPRHRKHTASYDKDGQPLESTVPVSILTSVNLPDGSQFQMDYILTAADQRNSFEEPGMIRSLKLPTRGRYEWEYFEYLFPPERDSSQQGTGGTVGEADPWDSGEGVRYKRLYDGNNILVGTWTYAQGDRPPTQPAPPPLDDGGSYEVRTWVTDPLGHQTVHYFQNRSGAFGYGLPFSPLLTDATSTRFLSREVFNGSAATSNRLRSEYLLYENDPAALSGNERVVSRRTVHHDDEGRYADIDFSDFDGFGHYRTATTGGSFGAGDVRTTFTDFNPSRGTLGELDFTEWPEADPWVLNTYAEQQITEGGETEIRQTSFDAATGVLLGERLLAGTAPAAQDVVRTYDYDTNGFLTREEHTGGDGPNGLYVFRHTPQYGVRAKTEVLDGTRVLVTTLDQDIDQSTGLTSAARDSAGAATTFSYDLLGRVVREEPPDEAAILTVFKRATSSTRARIVVKREDPTSPGDDRLCSSSTDLQCAQFDLDALGRVVEERHRRPDGYYRKRETEYDAAGHKSRVSEFQAGNVASSSLHWTRFENYDPFGRVGRIVSPDGHSVDIQYEGTRSVIRKVHGVATSTAGTEQTATTFETYDRQGRLIGVNQASGPAGEFVSTQYSYDPSDRLTKVKMLGVEGTQIRTFDYDGRGFLLSETHPEITGAVLYSGYDPLGNVGRKRSGDRGDGTYHTDLTFSYDPGGRLVQVAETGGRLFKEFAYATANGPSDLRAGKLVQAKRHNYVPDVSNPGADLHRVVTETFVYGGRGGRLSEKRLRGTDPIGSAAASFSQSYSYDLLGNVAAEVYPSCLSPRCERYGPPRTLTYEYRQGALTGIPGWVDSITYHPNGLLSQIRHFNDMTDTWGNDPNAMSRPGSISFSGRSSLDLGAYAYDGAGNVQAMGTDLFAYDLVSRLTEADLQAVAKGQSYSYDSFGNLTDITTTEAGVPTARPIGVSATTNRLTGAGYDAAGNVTSLFTLAPLTYDPFNRVTHLTGTGVNRSFLYDTSDNRIAIIDHLEGTEEWHLRGLHDKVVRSFKSTEEGWQWEKDWVYREGQLVGSSHHARWREYHLDHLGSPRLVTGPIGLTVAEYHPLPFGEMASATGPAVDGGEPLFRYTGHERDENCETGNCAPEGQDDLDYMLARFYSPVMGRFLGVDPVVDDRRGPRISQLWNRYSYSLNNPLRVVDPTGARIRFVDDALRVLAIELAEDNEEFRLWLQSLRDADQLFVFQFGVVESKSPDAEGKFFYTGTGKKFGIILLRKPASFTLRQNLAHEVRHAFDFLERRFGFVKAGAAGIVPFMYDVGEEVRAFQAALAVSTRAEKLGLTQGRPGDLRKFHLANEGGRLEKILYQSGYGGLKDNPVADVPDSITGPTDVFIVNQLP